MKKKIFIGFFLLVAVMGLVYMVIINTIFHKNEEIISEYVPEVEISDSELRKTLVTLYFFDKDENIKSEERMIDSKELLRNPYIALIGMLLEGPKSSDLESVIPAGTRIIDAKLDKKCVIVNLSKEFVEAANGDVYQKSKMINTIVNTLTELNEVQTVKFLIEGEEVKGFDEETIQLTNEFSKNDFQ